MLSCPLPEERLLVLPWDNAQIMEGAAILFVGQQL